MKNLVTRYFVLLLLLSGFPLSCKTSKNNYINPDSSDLFSTNPARPFKYGYAYDRITCEKYFKDRIIDFGIKNGDVIADVGAASGWLDGIYSVLVDSVTFYVQDIDSHYLDQQQLDAVVNHYSHQRLSPQTNHFRLVMGTTEQTNLPDSTFDKIIVCNTLHEITDPGLLIADLGRKLKPGGKVIILDQFSNIYKKIIHPGCGIQSSLAKDVIKEFHEHGFYLTSMKNPQHSMLNVLTFEKDQSTSLEYLTLTKKLDAYLAKLDLLNQKNTSADSSKVAAIGSELKSHLPEIHAVFPTLTNYLDKLTDQWLEEKLYTNAINVIWTRLLLYPDDAKGYNYMGYTLTETKKYTEACNWFSKAIQIDENNADYFSSRGDALVKLAKYDEALEDYFMAITLDSSEADYHYNVGFTYEMMGSDAEAIPYYSKAIQLEPYEHEYLSDRCDVYYYIEDYENAIKDISKAIELDPENWGYYRVRARLKKESGDMIGFKEDIKKSAQVRSKK